MGIMPKRGPILHALIDNGEWLHIRCSLCLRERTISAHEACYTYGHGTTFDELRWIIKQRCRVGSECPASAGVALPHEIPRLIREKVP
jgi:hypothetical protein